MTSRRLKAARAATVLVSSLAGLVAAELVARATYGPGFFSVVDPYEHHPYRAYAELPDGAGTPIFTNSLGWKDDRPDREVALDPAPKRRVVFLGDSFTEGFALPQEETFSAEVERRLNREGERFEVLNGGRVSYSPLPEYMRFKRFLAAGYRTDVVVLLPDLSDVQDELDYAMQYELSPGGEPTHLRSGNYHPAVRWIYNRSALARWIRRGQLRWQGRLPVAETAHSGLPAILQPAEAALLQTAAPLSTEAYFALPAAARAVLRQNWSDHRPSLEGWAGEGLRLMEDRIDRIHRLAQSRGIRLIVVVYPYPQTLYTASDPALYRVLQERFPKWFQERKPVFGTRPSDGATAWREAIRKICRERSIPFLDLFPVFQRTPGWPRLFLAGDVHFDAPGHHLVGREIAEEIRRILAEARP